MGTMDTIGGGDGGGGGGWHAHQRTVKTPSGASDECLDGAHGGRGVKVLLEDGGAVGGGERDGHRVHAGGLHEEFDADVGGLAGWVVAHRELPAEEIRAHLPVNCAQSRAAIEAARVPSRVCDVERRAVDVGGEGEGGLRMCGLMYSSPE